MNRESLPRRRLLLLVALAGAFLLAHGSAAQVSPPAPAAATGSISGRILNPATGDYVRNAEVSIRGTTLAAVSEDDGTYRIAGVPAGDAVLTVNYTGSTAVTVTVAVRPGEESRRDIELISALAGPVVAGVSKEEILRLEAFTVSGEREGNAKAIMEQRQSMNITNTVASDVFGDVAEGNVGEFLKNMPGVDLFLVQGEIVQVRLRGLSSEYNSVTVDGVRLASADANKGTSADARAFSFEQASLNSMDSIEVSKTISADVDANAPAGTINLKTKRAFSRSGRRIAWQANLAVLTDAMRFGRAYGPDDAQHRRLRPGGMIEYSDVFLGGRLGAILNLSESNMYSENARTVVGYNYTTTATDTRPVVPTSVALYQSPRINRRSTVTLTADLKATADLVLSLGLIYNAASLYNIQRTETFTATNRAAVVGDDPLAGFTAAGRITTNPSAVVKPGEAYTVLPKFEYKRGSLTIEGRMVGSESTSWYNPLPHKGSSRSAGSPQLANVSVRALHQSDLGGDWQLLQTAGSDLGSGSGYSSPTLQINDGRFSRTRVYSGNLSASWKTSRFFPIAWKTGLKAQREIRDFLNDSDSKNYSYTGPGAGTGAWANYASPLKVEPLATDASLTSSSGQTVFVPSLLAIGQLYREHPEYFTSAMTAANYYNAYVANTKHYEEEITAGFGMATASFGRMTVRAGLRWEDTATDAYEFDPHSPAEVRAAGFAVTGSTGRAATIPGLQYQYFSQPKIHRTGGFDNFFPSASCKYRFSPNLDLQFGYSSTIRRATFRDLVGVWSINDTDLSVNVPNPNLKPEKSDNFAARMAYYFEPVGIFAFNLFQNTVRGLHQTNELTAQEFGYAEDELADYTFVTTTTSDDKVRIRGMELEYSQSLSFLPRPFKGLNVRASYTRNYSQIITTNMSPHGVNAGVNWSFPRFTLYTSANWRDNVPTNTTGTAFNRHRATQDFGGSIKFSRRFEFFFNGRNLHNAPVITMQKTGSAPAVPTTYELTSAIWTFGIKGAF